MKYYIIAGEASGDLHAANLMRSLQAADANATFRIVGGDKMKALPNTSLFKHISELSFMGFVEVIGNLPTILGNLKFCKQDILNYQPDVLILVDYPGFNLRIAEWAKQVGIKVVYYIAPQVWAWKANRVKKMKQCIHLMLCILPFEKAYFKDNWNWEVEYIGHPLIEVIEDYKFNHPKREVQHIIALLPGSRKQEITKKLPIMLSVAKYFPEYQFVVAKAPGQLDSFYEPFLAGHDNVAVVKNSTYELLVQAKAALVTSGTATLETALFGVPEVVCYKTSNISFQIAKRLIKIKFISLVNLIMNRLIVQELIQDQLNTSNLVAALNPLLHDEPRQAQLKKDYLELNNTLRTGGNASEQAATRIIQYLKKD
ncbi:MAG: lipid-A-disaccharide synthase [Sphingobacteriia bacterium]|nr:MAG: lipid-A-disaccharide synthase [Sphingobacteriia bacterium]